DVGGRPKPELFGGVGGGRLPHVRACWRPAPARPLSARPASPAGLLERRGARADPRAPRAGRRVRAARPRLRLRARRGRGEHREVACRSSAESHRRVDARRARDARPQRALHLHLAARAAPRPCWPRDPRARRARPELRDVRLPAAVKKRLDVVLVERGLAESRAQAQALVLAGLVHGYAKPGQPVEEDADLSVERPPPYVSRGGEKLAHGLDALGVDPAGLDCVDVGASTGGFTDVLLQRAAARVIALDVGYGQLHPRLRADPRVTVLERTNARTLTELPFPPQLAVCDVSFISVRIALPPVLRLCAPGWQAVVLVKPQ